MQDQGIEGGIMAIKCIDPTVDDWLNTIPPLGTLNEDGVPTEEDTAAATIAGTYLQSQAVLGGFELMYGKNTFSVNADENSTDNMDITYGSDVAKGYQNVEGTFEFSMLNESSRWDGAVLGNWDYADGSRAYYRRKAFRPYEMWILFTPDDKRLDTADAAERLWVFIGLKLGRVEVEAGQPTKFRVPFKAKRLFKFPNWVEQSPANLITGQAITDDTTYSLSTPISRPEIFHTRLKFTFTDVNAGTKSLQIRGYNIYGERIVENVDVSSLSGAAEYITKNYFSSVETLGITTVGTWFNATTDMDVDEYDVGLSP